MKAKFENIRFTRADKTRWAADLPGGGTIGGGATTANRHWRAIVARGLPVADYVEPDVPEEPEAVSDPVQKLRDFLGKNPEVAEMITTDGTKKSA